MTKNNDLDSFLKKVINQGNWSLVLQQCEDIEFEVFILKFKNKRIPLIQTGKEVNFIILFFYFHIIFKMICKVFGFKS
jgi:hypothetical protein